MVEHKVGRKVSDDYLWDLLKCNGWKKKMPRPRHPKRTLAEQQEFKKTPQPFGFPALISPGSYSMPNFPVPPCLVLLTRR
ncbi:MAG: winged helix-turn-helix domain-containing protein [Chitinophagaceae bacterium]|nr:winged helix-turn-helix domain-containing protein [Chitinophagaceae bacterium]MCW5926278.1 winged helix-turn-helix domain-containing protein [Chitinophagaceae bacterium]